MNGFLNFWKRIKGPTGKASGRKKQQDSLLDTLKQLTKEIQQLQNELGNVYTILLRKDDVLCKAFNPPGYTRPMLLTTEREGVCRILKVYDPRIDTHSLATAYLCLNENDAVLDSFFVTMMYRRKKIGTALMNQVIEEVRANGKSRLIGHQQLEPEGFDPFAGFLNKLGFKVEIDRQSGKGYFERTLEKL